MQPDEVVIRERSQFGFIWWVVAAVAAVLLYLAYLGATNYTGDIQAVTMPLALAVGAPVMVWPWWRAHGRERISVTPVHLRINDGTKVQEIPVGEAEVVIQTEAIPEASGIPSQDLLPKNETEAKRMYIRHGDKMVPVGLSRGLTRIDFNQLAVDIEAGIAEARLKSPRW